MADGEGKQDLEPVVRKDGPAQEDSLEEIKRIEGMDAGDHLVPEKDEIGAVDGEEQQQQGQTQLKQFDKELVEEDIFHVEVRKNRFNALFDTMPEVGIFHDGKKILNVNKGFEKASGYVKDEVVGKPLSRFLKGNRLIRKDGSTPEMIVEQSGAEENFIIIMSDVGSLREMEKYYALFNIMSDHIKDAVMQVDLKGNILYANAATGEMFGLPVSDISKKSLKDLLKRKGVFVPLAKKAISGEDVFSEVKCMRGDRTFLASILVHNINNGKELICILRDIGSERELKVQIEQAREEHDQLVNNVNDIIFEMDNQGNFKYVNYQFEKQLGYKTNEVKSIVAIIYPEDLQNVVSSLSESKKGFKDLEFRILDSRRRDFYFSMNAAPVKEGSRIVGFRGTMRNIAEKKKAEDKTEKIRKKLEEENKRMEQREKITHQFVSSVSHDLKTPLTSIQGYSELLSNKLLGDLNKDQEEASNVIHSEAKHLGKLINDLLDVSRIDAGALVLNRKPFLLSSLEERCSCKSLIDRKGLTMLWNTPDSIGEVYADPDRIAQVLTNLISNSIKFTERGSVTVNAFNKNRKFIQIDVIDTGIGIPKKEKDKVFERFHQADEKRKKEGTGLGLSISRDIIWKHGGDISVDSNYGKGAKISLTIPKYSGIEEQSLKLDEIIEDSRQNTEDLGRQEVAQSVIEAINKTNENKESKPNP